MRSLLVPAALVAAALALPATPSHAAAASCHGLPATIEASTGEVAGTPGNDVIVVSGTVTRVDAGDGDDVICLVDTHHEVRVFAGSGDDIVDTEGTKAGSFADLGKGFDHFLGGPGPDHIRSRDPRGADTLITRAGDDSVVATSPVNLDLGTGDDSLVLLAEPDVSNYLFFGPGNDTITVGSPGNLLVDLRQHVLRLLGETSMLKGAEDVRAVGNHVVIRGDGHRNTFTAAGCHIDLYGSGGNDRLAQVAQDGDGPASCASRRARLNGGPGNDIMRGYSGNDLIIGGPGRDQAYGAGGTDSCDAEQELTCER
jgi:Ca2+-binding RTX toxin-like protein